MDKQRPLAALAALNTLCSAAQESGTEFAGETMNLWLSKLDEELDTLYEPVISANDAIVRIDLVVAFAEVIIGGGSAEPTRNPHRDFASSSSRPLNGFGSTASTREMRP